MPTPLPQSDSCKRVFIVDDHPMMRQGIAHLIADVPDLILCGEAGDSRNAMEAIAKLAPDIVLADITLPDRNGLEMIKDLVTINPRITVLVVSMHEESLYAERALRAGARGYVMKHEGGARLLEAIRQVLGGQVAVSSKISSRILESFSGRRTKGETTAVEQLTDREFEVFQLIGSGRSTREIADQLQLSAKTVEAHRSNIKAKLDLKSAPELISFAARWSHHSGTN